LYLTSPFLKGFHQFAQEKLSESTSQKQEGRVLVFIPSFNDSVALPGLLAEIAGLGRRYQPLVIDDGSPEAVLTSDLMGQCLHATLPANFGLGVCTHIAFTHALRLGYGAVVRVDGDGQHRVSDILRLMQDIDSGVADLVAGVRTNQGRGRGVVGRNLAKSYFSGLARRMTKGCAPRDVNTGFFAANSKALKLLNQVTLERFSEPEMYVSACRAGLRVRSVEVEQRDRTEGRSTLHLLGAASMFFRFNVFVFGQLFRRWLP
jgi:hypothetical protein